MPESRRARIACLSLLFLLAAVHSTAGQAATRQDSSTAAALTWTGNWAATDGSATLSGTFTALPDTAHGTVTGTWTLNNAQGKAVAYGAWSAARAPDRWAGAWRAVVAGQTGEYTGTFTASVDLKAGTQFSDLFEKAVAAMVSGTWQWRNKSGAWSIRTAPKRSP